MRDVRGIVVTHHLCALDTMSVQTHQCSAAEAHDCALPHIGQHLDVVVPCGVINGRLDPVVTDASKVALPLARYALSNLTAACQLFTSM